MYLFEFQSWELHPYLFTHNEACYFYTRPNIHCAMPCLASTQNKEYVTDFKRTLATYRF